MLTVAERLRAKHLVRSAPGAEPMVTAVPALLPGAARHPERFGSLSGSVRVSGDIESSVDDADLWTFDAKNLGV